MSNVIKSVYFSVDPANSRKIDSDENVEEYIPNIFDQQADDGDSDFQLLDFSSAPHLDGGGFAEGVFPVPLEEEADEEQRKLSEQIEAEKNEILEQARAEADAIVAKAKEDADAVFAAAKTEGFLKGSEEARFQMNKELQDMQQKLQAEYEKKADELDEEKRNLEPAFADVVISLVRKITGVLCEDKREIILYLIGNAIRNAGKTSSIVLRVSKKDIALVISKKATLKTIVKDVVSFDVVEDESLVENQCIIETDHKIIDCSLDSELQNLEEHMKLLANYTGE